MNKIFEKLKNKKNSSIVENQEGIFTKIPVCIMPWTFLGAAWGKYAICCNSYNLDFGDITDSENINNFRDRIFNSESYIKMRQSLAEGRLLEPCKVCPNKIYGGGGLTRLSINIRMFCYK